MKKRENKLLIIIFIILLIIPIISGSLFFNEYKEKNCGDGTSSGNCSEIQPYFCKNEILIERASICGCPEIKNQSGDSCYFEYQKNPKRVRLKYLFDGKEEEIGFTLYEGILNEINKKEEIIRYTSHESPNLKDFKLSRINEKVQREGILPLVIKIENRAPESKIDQARIAISIVQNIEYGKSNKTLNFFGRNVENSRRPYEVLYDEKGICGEKSELLVLLLKEIGYDVAFLSYPEVNHEAVGIKCPKEESLYNSGYCFVETTGPSIINDDTLIFSGGYSLEEKPEIINVSSGGLSLPKKIKEYRDSKKFASIREKIKTQKWVWPLKKLRFKILKDKYGIPERYSLV